jgi:hypothetical protein
VISDIDHVFNARADLACYVSAVNICVRAQQLVQHTQLNRQWRATNLRDWVLILDHGSRAQDITMQGHWASLLATSVLPDAELPNLVISSGVTSSGAAYLSPRHVDVTAQLNLQDIDALEHLYHTANPVDLSSRASVDATAVEASYLCKQLNLRASTCKLVLRHLHELGLVQAVTNAVTNSEDPHKHGHKDSDNNNFDNNGFDNKDSDNNNHDSYDNSDSSDDIRSPHDTQNAYHTHDTRTPMRHVMLAPDGVQLMRRLHVATAHTLGLTSPSDTTSPEITPPSQQE